MKIKKVLARVLVLLTVIGAFPIGDNCFLSNVRAEAAILTNGDADPILTDGDAEEEKTSDPINVKEEDIVGVEEATNVLIEGLRNAVTEAVTVFTKNEAPALTAEVFAAAIENGKDITISVTNDSNLLMYAWTFNNETLDINKVTAPLNLTISFTTDKQDEIKELMGEKDDLFII